MNIAGVDVEEQAGVQVPVYLLYHSFAPAQSRGEQLQAGKLAQKKEDAYGYSAFVQNHKCIYIMHYNLEASSGRARIPMWNAK